MPPWANIEPSLKFCFVCGGEFYAKRTSAKYCSGKCSNSARSPRSFDSAKSKEWRRRRMKRQEYRKSVNAKANARATRLRRFLSEIKLGRGCVDCGYAEHPAALDFDHVRGKKKILVSFAKSEKQALEEIEKCDVRCANCHRIKTWERKQ